MNIRNPYAFAAGIGTYFLVTAIILVSGSPGDFSYLLLTIGLYHSFLMTSITRLVLWRLEQPPIWAVIIPVTTLVSIILVSSNQGFDAAVLFMKGSAIFSIAFTTWISLQGGPTISWISTIILFIALIGWNYVEHFCAEPGKIAIIVKRILLSILLLNLLFGLVTCTVISMNGIPRAP